MREHPAHHTFDRRTFFQAGALGLTGARLSAASSVGEILPNGMRLPSSWPPRRTYSLGPMPLPYLDKPPAVIPIDVGRQLFVDDFLIAHSTLTRTYHAAKYHAATPVLKPDQPWEKEGGPTAMVFLACSASGAVSQRTVRRQGRVTTTSRQAGRGSRG
jgi:hypothetical protein